LLVTIVSGNSRVAVPPASTMPFIAGKGSRAVRPARRAGQPASLSGAGDELHWPLSGLAAPQP
jgi:hypothetical protein